ncbi:glycosyltransferase [Butyrivibrio sp. NC3005]|uniref:glycosyltransferase n=1 Tax=Butyrivibrio sp. NC3005 TaxID=1280685 RepID=UPI000425678B|nr:glycosyltransferase family 2 protein [Butyrivibrio sp. NC3005]
MNTCISIIIPAYNIEGYIGKCLDSALNQDFPQNEIEVIVIDDGSTDETGKIIDTYAEKDSRIKVIHKKNEGVSAARNDGISIAKGKYILFFDGDDFEKQNTCTKLVEIAEKDISEAVIFGYYKYESQSNITELKPIFSKDKYEGKIEIFNSILPYFVGLSFDSVNNWIQGKKNSLYVENPALWHVLLRKDVIINNNLSFDTTLKVGEDTVFITEYISCCNKVSVCHDSFYYLVTRESSAIFRYEREPFSKLEGKKRLNIARVKLTNRIKNRSKIDITPTWSGTILMSVVEMAFLLSAKNNSINRRKRYEAFRSFADEAIVRNLVSKYNPCKSGSTIKKIPLLMVKKGHYKLLFDACTILHLFKYKFTR